MVRKLFALLGAVFTFLILGSVVIGAFVTMIVATYGKGLPKHEQLVSYEPSVISRVYGIDGQVMDEFAQERRIFTPIDEIPLIVKQAFISAEDKNFYTHTGFDVFGMAKAALDAAQGQNLRGASTITQQVTKNFLLSNERSVDRKIRELILSARVERSLSKQRILELYLNEIFLGQNSYGVTAAARVYFAKALEDLTLEEAAYLAALPKAPSTYHPVRRKERAIARRNFVLREMRQNGFATEEQVRIARATDLITVQSSDDLERLTRPDRTYFTDEIRRQLSQEFGEEQFFTAGYSIRASLDSKLQTYAERALQKGLQAYDRQFNPYKGAVATLPTEVLGDERAWRKALRNTTAPRDVHNWHVAVVLSVDSKGATIGVEGFVSNPARDVLSFEIENEWAVNKLNAKGDKVRINSARELWAVGDVILVQPERDEAGDIAGWSLRQIPKIQGAFMAMDTNTGRVLAMQGGFSYQHSVFNRVTQANRQPGSVFKPFVYAAALDSGYSPASVVVDAPVAINTPEGLWQPKNSSEKYYGLAPLRIGIEQSRNLMTIRLAQSVGMDIVSNYAETFGIYDSLYPVLSSALGAQETTLYKIVSAYAMFANGGERVNPTLIDRIQDRHGQTIFRHDTSWCLNCDVADLPEGAGPAVHLARQRMIDEITAFRLVSMLRGVVERGTAFGRVVLDVPTAGKTGTTNEAKDVWFVGFTRNLVAGCYMGFDVPKPLGQGAYGGSMCAPVFQEFMSQALESYDAGDFAQPEDTLFYKFDRFSGARLANDATGANVIEELFRTTDDPQIGLAQTAIDGGFQANTQYDVFSGFSNIGLDKLLEEEAARLERERIKAGGAPVPVAPELAPADATAESNPDEASTPKPPNADGTSFGTLSSGGLY